MLTLEDNILVRQPKWAVFERGKVRESALELVPEELCRNQLSVILDNKFIQQS